MPAGFARDTQVAAIADHPGPNSGARRQFFVKL